MVQQNRALEEQERPSPIQKPLKKRKLAVENRPAKKPREAAVTIAMDTLADPEVDDLRPPPVSTIVTQTNTVLNNTSSSLAGPGSPMRPDNSTARVNSPLSSPYPEVDSQPRMDTLSPLSTRLPSPSVRMPQSLRPTVTEDLLNSHLNTIYDFPDSDDDDSVLITRNNIRASTPVPPSRTIPVKEDILLQMMDRIDKLERKTEALQREVTTLKENGITSNTGKKSIRPESLVSIPLTEADVIKLQPSNTTVPVYFVDQETLQRTKQQCSS